MPVLARFAPHAVQTRLDPLLQAVVSYWALVHEVHVAQTRFDPLVQAVVSYWPAEHVAQATEKERERKKRLKQIDMERRGEGTTETTVISPNVRNSNHKSQIFNFVMPCTTLT